MWPFACSPIRCLSRLARQTLYLKATLLPKRTSPCLVSHGNRKKEETVPVPPRAPRKRGWFSPSADNKRLNLPPPARGKKRGGRKQTPGIHWKKKKSAPPPAICTVDCCDSAENQVLAEPKGPTSYVRRRVFSRGVFFSPYVAEKKHLQSWLQRKDSSPPLANCYQVVVYIRKVVCSSERVYAPDRTRSR